MRLTHGFALLFVLCIFLPNIALAEDPAIKNETKTSEATAKTPAKTKASKAKPKAQSVPKKTSKKKSAHKTATTTNNQPEAGVHHGDVNSQINNMLSRFGENINIGIIVQNIKTGQMVYAHNPSRYFVPASNQKILTAYAALNFLGPDFVFQTKLYADSTKVVNNVLNDNATLKFSGDPEFMFSQLDGLIKSLQNAGIHTINGKFIIDDNDFDYDFWPPGAAYEDRKACFGAPISSVIINRNCLGIELTGRQKLAAIGGAAPLFVNFNNELATQGGRKCVPQLQYQGDNNYGLSGCLRRGARLTLGIVVQNPHLYGENVVAYLLKKYHIDVRGGVVFGKANPQDHILAVHNSRPLRALVTRMLKKSDNIIANALYKTLGLAYNHTQSTWENSSLALRAILTKNIGIQFSDDAFIDGAGLSRYNHVTPAQINALLQRAYQQYNVIPEAITGLPIAGVDGTLHGRMSQIARRVRAKTGSEISVCSLSGYIFTRNNQTLTFSILINGFVGSLHRYRALEDRICTILADMG